MKNHEKVKWIRTKAKLLQADVAKSLSVHVGAIIAVENGAVTVDKAFVQKVGAAVAELQKVA